MVGNNSPECEWCYDNITIEQYDGNHGLCAKCSRWTMANIEKNKGSNISLCDNYLVCGKTSVYTIGDVKHCVDCHNGVVRPDRNKVLVKTDEKKVDVTILTPEQLKKHDEKFVSGLRKAMAMA